MVLMGHHSDSGSLKGGYESDGIIDLVKNTKEMYIPLLWKIHLSGHKSFYADHLKT